jgi:ADP-ribose pyrophosphatase YjhB (NUDIX family)
MKLSRKETAHLVALLGEIERPYPQDLFHALCAATITCPVEIIPLTRAGKVLLTRRPPHDPWFANLWHTPGTIQLPGDTISGAIARVIRDELNNVHCSAPEYLGYGDIMKGDGPDENPRGQERPLLFVIWVEEDDYLGDGSFFSLDSLPEEILPHHKNIFLPLVRKQFFERFKN